MNIVRFVLPDRTTVDYDFGGLRVPAPGETILADGSDPEFPAGEYEVGPVSFEIGLRGPRAAICPLTHLGHLPDRSVSRATSPSSRTYKDKHLPRETEDEAREAGVMGWNLQCRGCDRWGAQWRNVFPGRNHVALCDPCNDRVRDEKRRHQLAMRELTGK